MKSIFGRHSRGSFSVFLVALSTTGLAGCQSAMKVIGPVAPSGVYYDISGTDSTPKAEVTRRVGNAQVVGNQIFIQPAGEDLITFDYIGFNPTWKAEEYQTTSAKLGTISLFDIDLGEVGFVFLPTGYSSTADFLGIFGDLADTSSLSGPATYAGQRRSGVALSIDGQESRVVLGGGSVNLSANFTTGDISGTLYNEFTNADFNGNTSPDIVDINLTLENGGLSGGSITGNVAGSMSVTLDGGSAVDTAPVFSNTSVEGAVLGTTAGWLAGGYQGDIAFTDAEGAKTGEFVGLFAVQSN